MIKKGSIVIRAIIFVTISAVILGGLIYIGKSYGSGEVYRKLIIAKEIALILDAIYAYPYDSLVYYEKDLTGLIVEVSNNKVIVYNAQFNNRNLDPTSVDYSFIPTTINKINAKLENPKKIKFQKFNDIIILKNEIDKQ